MRVKCKVAYDGTNYLGFQRQSKGVTIQGTIEAALLKITKTPVTIHSSGRTDSGVHALGQVFHFDSDVNMKEDNWKRALNTYLPKDIQVLDVAFVSSDFHSRFSATKKEYRYYLSTTFPDVFKQRHVHYERFIDEALLKEAICKFVGTHDFKGFCQYIEEKDTIKTLYRAEVNYDNGVYELIFVGNGFLRYMVRGMVGTLIDIARKKKDIHVIDKIFATQNRALCGKTANAKGLFLMDVSYD